MLYSLNGLRGALLVLAQQFAGGGNFQAAYLHQVVDNADLLNVVTRVEADAAAALLGRNLRELFLPKSQKRFVDAKLFCHFFTGEKAF